MLKPGADIDGYRLLARLRELPGGELFLALNPRGERVTLAAWPLDQRGDCPPLNRAVSAAPTQTSLGGLQLQQSGIWPPSTVGWASFKPAGVLLSMMSSNSEMPCELLTLGLGRAIAQALDPFHQRGFSWGALEPDRVFFGPDGRALPMMLNGAPDDEGAAPRFRAPEILSGQTGGPAADAWSLGVILYTLAQGFTPFGDQGPDQLLAAIDRGLQPGWPEGWKSPTIRVLETLLAPVPQDRPANATQIIALIDAALTELRVDPLSARREVTELARQTLDACAVPPPGSPSPATELMGHESQGTLLMPPPAEELPPPASPATELMAPPPTPQPGPKTQVSQVVSPPETLLEEGIADHEEAEQVLPSPAGSPVPDLETMRARAPAEKSESAFPKTVAVPTLDTGLKRRAAARWYTRMNPHENFPLDVAISGGKIQLSSTPGTKLSFGEMDFVIDPQDPIVEVQPQFPGCLISPTAISADVSEENTALNFWVTPLAEGQLEGACIQIRHKGRLVQVLPTPSRVKGRAATRFFALAGILGPVLVQVLEGMGWSLAGEVEKGFPKLQWLNQQLWGYGIAITLAVILLVAALIFHITTRPIRGAASLHPAPAL